MMMNNIKIGLVATTLFFATQGFSQTNNVVSAGISYKGYESALYMQNDLKKAKANLLDAKKYIDPAMLDEKTKVDPKAHYYNVLINFGLIGLAGIDETGELDVYKNSGDSILNVIKSSVEIANSNRRWKAELTDFFNGQTRQAVQGGNMMFEQKKYDMAFAGFAGAYQIKKIAGIKEDLEAMEENSIISARNYLDTLSKEGKTEDAMEFVTNALIIFPGNEVLAIEGVNLALSIKDLEKAEEYFNIAAAAAPDNKALFSNMGSIYLTEADKNYTDFQKMSITDAGYQEKSDKVESLYSKAETNLKKALEIDANYVEAAYNLGVLYLGRGEKLKTEASQMDFNNPDYNKVNERSLEMYKNAIGPLEVYIKNDPKNVGVLNVLFQVHRHAGNDEKAMEYRKRAQEIEAE